MRFPLPRNVAALAAIVLTGPLFAFVPSADRHPLVTEGPMPRVSTVTPEVQKNLRLQGPYLEFQERYGGTWEAEFDEFFGTPIFVRGSGIPLIPDYQNATKSQVLAISSQFVKDNAELLGAAPRDLRATDVEYAKHIWVVYYQRYQEGLPVIGSQVGLIYKFGRLILIYGDSYPERALPGVKLAKAAPKAAASLSAESARDRVTAVLGLDATRKSRGQLVVYPIFNDAGVDFRLAWEIVQQKAPSADDTGYHFISYVDARSGEILEMQNGHRYQFSGTVQSRVDTRTVGDPIITVPNKEGRVAVGSSVSYTNASGNWNQSGSGSATLSLDLRGRHCNVNNNAGADMSISHSITAGTPSTDTFNASNELTLAQTQTYRGVQDTNELVRTVHPNNNWLNTSVVTANVNINSSCNAFWFNNSVNFYRSGGGCNNTGRIFDIVAHELGHGVDQNLPGSSQDGGLGEFIGDLMAFTQTNSPNVGPGFTTGGGSVRNLNPGPSNLRCYSSSVSQVHSQGNMLGIVVWDIWVAMRAKGLTGQDLYDKMMLPISTSQRLTNWYNGMLVADDDDGNLANGTPFGCDIWQMFDEHSGPNGAQCANTNGSRWPGVPTTPVQCTGINLPPLADFTGTPRGGTAPLNVQFSDASARTPTSWQWSFGDGGTSNQENPSHTYQASGTYTVTLTATNSFGSDTETKVDYITVGSTSSVYCENFDSGSPNWTSGGTADEWQIGTPQGNGSAQGPDPNGAFSAPNAMGTDFNVNNGDYEENNIQNWIESPAIDCTGLSGTVLKYRRWLAVEDGIYDQAEILVNNNQVWVNSAGGGTQHHIDTSWVEHTVDISQYADDNPNVRIRFRITSDDLLAFGGWNIDDLCVEGVSGGGGSGNGTEEILSGAGPDVANAPVVKTWNHANPPSQVSQWSAYSASSFGTNVAGVDISGGGTSEVVTGPGPGGIYGPQIRGFSSSGAALSKVNYFAYGTLKFGAFPGGGNVDGDAHGEIVSTPGPGAVFGPHGRGWNYDASSLSAMSRINFFAYSTLRYGARASAGDFDADGIAEIVTGAGAGAVFSPHVRGFNHDNAPLSQIFNLFAFATGQYGADVAAGQTDGDARDEVIAAHGPDGTANGTVVAFNYGAGGGVSSAWSVAAYALGGVEVAAGDLDNDGQDELVAGAGWGVTNSAKIKAYEITGSSGALIPGHDWEAYSGQIYGTKVGVGDTGI